MKILLITPAPTDLFCGSATTVRRWRESLQRRGHLCELIGDTNEGGIRTSLEGSIDRFKPDIVHAHDAFRTGLNLLGLRIPWVVSVSGEDFHAIMPEHKLGPLVCEVFRRARRVLVPSDSLLARLEAAVPETVGKIDLVPRAAQMMTTDGTDLRRSLGIPKSRFLVLLPGGLRPIKGQHRALPLARALGVSGVDSELIIVGPEQDADYARELRRLAGNETGVRVLPSLSQERMGAAYQDADIVLNTSISEGMSPTVLEAGILGRPVVASDIPGNRDLVRHKETGLLYKDEEEMTRQVLALHRNRSAAGALGLRMREDFRRRFDPEKEVERLLSAYAAA